MGEPKHHHFHPRLAFLLNNPIRRTLSPPRRLLDRLNIKLTDVVVDFGCGPGFYTTEIARRALRAIAIDRYPAMLEKAQKAAEKAAVKVEVLPSDGTKIPLEDSSVDIILLVWVYHEIERTGEALKEFHRILREGGRLIIIERVGGLPLGPPKVDADQITNQVEEASLRFEAKLPYGGNAILVFRKVSQR